MRVTVLTLFPDMFPGPLAHSIPGKGLQKGLWSLQAINIRDFSHLKHQKVDDKPFGGGPGLVMRADIVDQALQHVLVEPAHLIHFSPKGRTLRQSDLDRWLDGKPFVLLCGHYEGIDQRVIDEYTETHGLEEVSIGDYVLSGGEMAALVFLDVLVRKALLPNAETLQEESFEIAGLEHPQYTLPRVYKDRPVPEILLSGHHQKIKAWKEEQSKEITRAKRPDLVSTHSE